MKAAETFIDESQCEDSDVDMYRKLDAEWLLSTVSATDPLSTNLLADGPAIEGDDSDAEQDEESEIEEEADEKESEIVQMSKEVKKDLSRLFDYSMIKATKNQTADPTNGNEGVIENDLSEEELEEGAVEEEENGKFSIGDTQQSKIIAIGTIGKNSVPTSVNDEARKKLESAYKTTLKTLAVLDTGNGEHIFFEIINAFISLRDCDKVKAKKIQWCGPEDSNEKVKHNIANKQETVIMLEMRQELRFLPKAQLHDTFYMLNQKLATAGVAINLFCEKRQYSYRFTKIWKDITEALYSNASRNRRLVSFAEPVLIGSQYRG